MKNFKKYIQEIKAYNISNIDELQNTIKTMYYNVFDKSLTSMWKSTLGGKLSLIVKHFIVADKSEIGIIDNDMMHFSYNIEGFSPTGELLDNMSLRVYNYSITRKVDPSNPREKYNAQGSDKFSFRSVNNSDISKILNSIEKAINSAKDTIDNLNKKDLLRDEDKELLIKKKYIK